MGFALSLSSLLIFIFLSAKIWPWKFIHLGVDFGPSFGIKSELVLLMRIRKRQVPLPLSSLSPVPVISDRQFNGSPPIVQLHPRRNPVQEHHRKSYSYSQPSGHPNQPIGITTHGSNGLDDADGSVAQTHKKIDALVRLFVYK